MRIVISCNILLFCSVDSRLTLQKQLHWELLPASRQDTVNTKTAGVPCTLIRQHGPTDVQPSGVSDQT